MSKPTSTSNNCVLTAELCGELEPNNVLEVFIENGARGKSAYEVWIDEGNTGNTTRFLKLSQTRRIPTFRDFYT